MLGLRMRQIRKQKGFKQEDVAELLGIPRPTYATYEQGRREPRYETISRFAEIFGVSLDYLIAGKNNDIESTLNKIVSTAYELVLSAKRQADDSYVVRGDALDELRQLCESREPTSLTDSALSLALLRQGAWLISHLSKENGEPIDGFRFREAVLMLRQATLPASDPNLTRRMESLERLFAETKRYVNTLHEILV